MAVAAARIAGTSIFVVATFEDEAIAQEPGHREPLRAFVQWSRSIRKARESGAEAVTEAA